ncbi:hypothetical protein CYLTODRAFT_55878 [Cylindrobasidium torrendii FP15055 ss-10]|uniref:HTH cro/C1-type domain-containing protein n=1 Tax=Cylindrobasidium torrendii FP15055 ss-10 TaxID=1314674 RepID=A0A0D7BRQ1_9AGAR|nr:hypothetical protein CYLTODRAFT_55878 [Cylindrobasidium torrendii FP15055 ss-10]
MAPNPQCAALAAAKEKSGLSYAQIATKIGDTEDRVIAICTGSQKPTSSEFNNLAKALGITSEAPHDSAHATVA